MCIFLYISFIFWTVSLIEGRGDAHVTPLVSMIDQTYLSPFILNHRSNETGPFRGTGLFYLYIGIKMTIVFYPRLDDLLLRFQLLQHVVSQARQTVHVNLINYEQCVWIFFPISYSGLHSTDSALPIQNLCIYWTRSPISGQWLQRYCMGYLWLSVLLNTSIISVQCG